MDSSADAKGLWTRCFDSFGKPLLIYRLGAPKIGNCYGEEGGTSSAQYLVDHIFVYRCDQSLPNKSSDV